MSRRIRVSQTDIVVVVPRWIIAVCAFVMMAADLSIVFLFLFAGLVPESLFMTLFVLILVPLQLLIAFITWRFYWFILALGMVLQALCGITVLTGTVRVAGMTTAILRGGTPVFMQGQALAIIILLAVALASLVSGIVVSVAYTMFGSGITGRVIEEPVSPNYDPYDIDTPPPPRPRKRSGPKDLWRNE